MSNSNEWILATSESGYTRYFEAESLPVSIGGSSGDDIRLGSISGSVQVGVLDGVFFVQAGRTTTNVRIGGELLRSSRRLADGDVIALDSARLNCAIAAGKLTVSIEARVTAGDTAPPDLEELARAGDEGGDEIAIAPVAFRSGAGAVQQSRSRRPRVATMVVAAAFAVLAVLAWFAFTAKSVQLVFEPAADEFSLPSTLFKFQLGDRMLLRSGTHELSAQLEGYYPLDTTVEVGPLPDQSFELPFTKLPGLITLRTEPEAGAEASIEGELLGQTPLVDFELEPGVHRIEFAADRYLPEVRELTVEGGRERQSLTAELTPDWAPVTISSVPPGADIVVDGETVGVTPTDVEITAGERRIEVRLGGYNAWGMLLNVVADSAQSLPLITLDPADGRIELVSVPSEAAVSVNGEYRGRTPLELRLSPSRTHEIVLSRPGYVSRTLQLSVAADSGRVVELELEAQLGEIVVQSTPPGAEIWVDGNREASTPATLNLLAISHDIEIRQIGYVPQGAEVTPRPGFTQTLNFDLEVLDDASGSGYPRIVQTAIGQELRLVPAGTFSMGSSRREQGRRSNETLRDVQISRAFYLGVREVSNAEFRMFRQEHYSGEFANTSLDGDEQPVVRVTWEDAVMFLNWLSARDGLQPVYAPTTTSWAPIRPLRNGYRLPTEAEWAWAARAAERDEPLVYPWGPLPPPPDRSGNYADLSAAAILPTTLVTYNDGFAVTAPTGSFEPNVLRIFDLGGNVSEWLQDFYEVRVIAPETLEIDPLGPETGRFNMIRGASWRSATVTDLRLAYRNYGSQPREDLGFRIARNLE